MTNGITSEVIGQLRAEAVAFKKSDIYRQIVEPRDQVLALARLTMPFDTPCRLYPTSRFNYTRLSFG
jgi:hypothetical protein